MAKYFGEHYLVVVIRKGNPYAFIETYRTLKDATKAYNLLVDPKNPHSLNVDVWISQVLESHHQKRD
jgi:hypothetical protein